MTAYNILKKGFKKWYGCLVGMQKELMGCKYSGDFGEFWEDVQDSKMSGIVIDVEPPKIIGIYGLAGVTYSKLDIIERLKSTNFSKEYRYFTLSTSQYDDFFLLYGFETKLEMLRSLKAQKSLHDFYISVSFKA